jgi:hypothetical protein
MDNLSFEIRESADEKENPQELRPRRLNFEDSQKSEDKSSVWSEFNISEFKPEYEKLDPSNDPLFNTGESNNIPVQDYYYKKESKRDRQECEKLLKDFGQIFIEDGYKCGVMQTQTKDFFGHNLTGIDSPIPHNFRSVLDLDP